MPLFFRNVTRPESVGRRQEKTEAQTWLGGEHIPQIFPENLVLLSISLSHVGFQKQISSLENETDGKKPSQPGKEACEGLNAQKPVCHLKQHVNCVSLPGAESCLSTSALCNVASHLPSSIFMFWKSGTNPASRSNVERCPRLCAS